MQKTLRAARRRQGLTLMELARLSGVNYSTISRLERGLTEPMLDTAKRLEQALGMKPGSLVFGAQVSA